LYAVVPQSKALPVPLLLELLAGVPPDALVPPAALLPAAPVVPPTLAPPLAELLPAAPELPPERVVPPAELPALVLPAAALLLLLAALAPPWGVDEPLPELPPGLLLLPLEPAAARLLLASPLDPPPPAALDCPPTPAAPALLEPPAAPPLSPEPELERLSDPPPLCPPELTTLSSSKVGAPLQPMAANKTSVLRKDWLGRSIFMLSAPCVGVSARRQSNLSNKYRHPHREMGRGKLSTARHRFSLPPLKKMSDPRVLLPRGSQLLSDLSQL
jgi:hypothetical protein